MAANQNVTQLTQQTGSASTSSLFYAVTGGSLDTGLPLSVFVNNLGLTGVPTAPTAAANTNTIQIATCAYVANYAPLSGATFTGQVNAGYTSPIINANDTSGAGTAKFSLSSSGTLVWDILKGSGATGNFFIERYNGGAFVDNPVQISNSTGLVTLADGLSTTTISTSGLVTASSLSTSSATINGGAINSTSVGATTPSSGAFTTLAASGVTTLSNGTTSSGSGSGALVVTGGVGVGNNVFAAGSVVAGGGLTGTIGAGTPNTGAFTTLSASSTVSGTGFSTYLASPPAIGLTTPASGKFTTLSTTSTFSPNPIAGIVGTTTNDNAQAGSIGEFSSASATAVSLSSSVIAPVTSISLTAGDWDVSGFMTTTPAGTTTTSFIGAGISTSNTAYQTISGGFQNLSAVSGYVLAAGAGGWVVAPTTRISISATTTVYLLVNASFSVSTLTASGFIRARRVR